MSLTLTVAALHDHGACGLPARVADLRRVLPDVTYETPVPLAVWWALPTTSIPDRWWSLRAVHPELPAQVLGVRAAALAARRVLSLVREQDRAVCLAAIEAAEAWANDPCERTRTAAVAAAVAAAAVAAVACTDVAYAAAHAADVASYTTHGAEREAQRVDLDRLLAEVTP